MRNRRDDNRVAIYIVVLLLLIFILLHFLIKGFGHIENQEVLIPTGNVDIFEIDCNCCRIVGKNDEDVEIPLTGTISYQGQRNEKSSGEDETSNQKIEEPENEIVTEPTPSSESEPEIEPEDEPEVDLGDLIVYDDYKIWDNKDLRIFSNPAYEYRSIIAPGSSNSYAFVIRNNNDFDVVVSMVFNESNDKGINMKYKLKHEGSYILGSWDNYEKINGVKVKNIELLAKSQKSYILDWKWVDSSNDTVVGFDINASYGLSILVGAK